MRRAGDADGASLSASNRPHVEAWRLEVTSVRSAAVRWLDRFLFTYLCAATAGELRHSRDGARVTEDHMKRLKRWHVDVPSKDRWMVQKAFLGELTETNVGQYLQDAIDVFGVRWTKDGYGGPKWQVIAETGRDRLRESITPVSFIDRVFDLRHNGGPMFDKNPAVDQSSVPQFLEAKAHLSTDDEWAHWLRYGSPRVLRLLRVGKLLGLWRGAAPDPDAGPPETETDVPRINIPKSPVMKSKWPAVVACDAEE
jgi:hypothetical protein